MQTPLWDNSPVVPLGGSLSVLRRSGFYVIRGAVDAPAPGEFHALVLNANAAGFRRTYQILWSISTGSEYFRTADNAGFGPWTERSAIGANPTASQVAYNNIASGLVATNVQAAIDELEARLEAAEGNITTLIANLATATSNIAALVAADAVLDGRLDAHDTDLLNLQTTIEGIETNIDNLETFSTDHETRLDAAEAKLVTIETGAEVNQTDAEIVAAINAQLGSTAWQNADPGSAQTNPSVRAASTGNITIASALIPGAVLDDVTLVENDVVAVKLQTDPAENGLYIVSATPSRHPSFDTFGELAGIIVTVQEGTVNGDTIWLCTSDDGGVIDVDPVEFVETAITPTNLSMTRDNVQVVINSSTGSGAAIPSVGPTEAGVMPSALFNKLAGIEPGADVTDADNVAAAGAVMRNDFNAQTILAATVDNTPEPLAIPQNTVVGRVTGGDVAALSAAQIRTMINVADGANNYVHPNHTGDVTSDGDGAQTIADGAVSNVKMANMASARIKGRVNVAAGAPEDLTPEQVRSIINVEDGAQVNQSGSEIADLLDIALGGDEWREGGGAGTGETNLNVITAPDMVTVTSDTGTDAEIPAATGSDAGVMAAADKSKLDGIEAGADVTDTANVTAAGAVMETDYNPHTILAAVTDDVPQPLTVDEATIVGRATGGNIAALTAAQVRAILNVADGAEVNPTGSQIADLLDTALGGTEWRDGGGGGPVSAADVSFDGSIHTALGDWLTNYASIVGADLDTVQGFIDALQMMNFTKEATNAGVRVRASTTGNINIATALVDGQIVGGVTLNGEDLVLVKDQTDPNENGIYRSHMTPTRAPAYADFSTLAGQLVVVMEGTNADKVYICTSNYGGSIGAEPIVFTEFTPGGGGGATDLSIANRDADSIDVVSSTGTDATLESATGSLAGLMSAADKTKLNGIEAGADVTDAANVTAAGAVMAVDYNAQTILAATTDNTPVALTVGEGTLLGRITGGNIAALTAAQIRTLLNVEDGATADMTGSEIVSAINSQLGSSDWQSGGEGGGGGGASRSFLAIKNAAQTAITTATKLTFGTESFDTDNTFASSRWTPGAAGIVIIPFALDVDNNGSTSNLSTVRVTLYKNGAATQYVLAYNRDAATGGVSGAFVAQTDADDYFELYGSAGVATDFNATSGSYFAGILLSGGGGGSATDITIARNSTQVTVESSTGADGVIAAADASNAGVMTSAQATKLLGIETGAQVNVGTNLSFSRTSTTVNVNSDTGTDATLPAADASNAGIMAAADKVNLDNLHNGKRRINAQTGTSYTLLTTDPSKLVTLSNAAPITLNVPTNATAAIAVESQIDFSQIGDGVVTIVPAVGVTLIAVDDKLVTAGKGATGGMIKLATDTWLVFGALVDA